MSVGFGRINMVDTNVTLEQFGLLVALIISVAAGYSKLFAEIQMYLTQSLIDAFQVESRYRKLLNIGLGVGIATAVSLITVLYFHEWKFMSVGVVAGIIASAQASKAHDAEKSPESSPETADETVN